MSGIFFHFCFSSHTIYEEQILLTWDLLHCLGFFNDMQKPVSPLQFFFSKKNILQGNVVESFFCTPEGVVTFSSHLLATQLIPTYSFSQGPQKE